MVHAERLVGQDGHDAAFVHARRGRDRAPGFDHADRHGLCRGHSRNEEGFDHRQAERGRYDDG